MAPLRVTILAKMAKYRQRAGNIQNVVNIYWMLARAFLDITQQAANVKKQEKIIRITLQGIGTGVH